MSDSSERGIPAQSTEPASAEAPPRVISGPIVADLGRPETPEEIAERKAEASRRHRASQNVRNLLIALGICLAIVFFLVAVVVRPDPPAREAVDFGAVASNAQSSSNEPLAVPELGDGWSANRAEFVTGGDGVSAWNIGFLTPKKQYIELTQGIDANPSWVAGQLGTAPLTGSVSIAGSEWQIYDNRDSDDPGNVAYGLVTVIGGSTIVLSGTAEDSEFEELATATATDLETQQ